MPCDRRPPLVVAEIVGSHIATVPAVVVRESAPARIGGKLNYKQIIMGQNLIDERHLKNVEQETFTARPGPDEEERIKCQTNEERVSVGP